MQFTGQRSASRGDNRGHLQRRQRAGDGLDHLADRDAVGRGVQLCSLACSEDS